MKRFGDLLIEAGLLTQAQIQEALVYSQAQGLQIGEALIQMGLISESDLLFALSKQLDMPILEEKEITVDPSLIHEIPYSLAQKHHIIPMCIRNGSIVFATSDPLSCSVIDLLESRLKKPVSLVLAGRKQIQAAIEEYFSGSETISHALKQVQQQEEENLLASLEADAQSLDDPPVIKFVHQMLEKAVQEGASDIHIEVDSVNFYIRFRIDGILQTMFRPKRQLHPLIFSRLKVMARLDVSEHRIPQDGRFKLTVVNEVIDFRVATIPCLHGETMVIRVLSQGPRFLDLSDLGFTATGLENLEQLLTRKHGLILVAGPTGSGKTSTLYSIVRTLNRDGIKIITIEDPVEIQLERLNQIQVNPRVDLTFATGLRSILRMDPDIILVGEIRDAETANLSVNAAMTGHLVLSTVHTGIAAEVPVRLIEMGVEPYLVANTLLGAAAQRLVRVNCDQCRESEIPPEKILRHRKPNFPSFRGKGCPACNRSGYRGRTCIEEVFLMTPKIRPLILQNCDSEEIHQAALAAGMRPLWESGLEKVRAGITSFEELARVL